jgi:AAA+ superfamily predicted ATPase
MTTSSKDFKLITDQWLTAELNRTWLVAERTLRSLQKAQIRPQPGHPSLAEVEGVLTARRVARLGGKAAGEPEDEAAIDRAVQELEAGLGELRQSAPIGRLIDNLALRPLEVETIVATMAPQIEAPLAALLNVLRGSGGGRRGVDLALLSQMFRLKRSDRIALLDAIDPERPLARWRLLEIVPSETLESFASLTHRAIRPTFRLISMLCGRGDLDSALMRSTAILSAEASLDDLRFDDRLRGQVAAVCEAARGLRGSGADFPWLILYGPNGAGKQTIASRVAAHAGRPLIAFNPTAVDRGTFDDVFQRAQCEAAVRDAMLYVGPLAPELEAEAARPLTRRLLGFRGMVAIGFDAMRPPLVAAEHPLQEINVTVPPAPVRRELWSTGLPESVRGEDLDLPALARAFNLTPGEIKMVADESIAIARGEGRKVARADARAGVDRRLRTELGELARQLTITVTWKDLILPDQNMARIQEFISRKKHKDLVYEQWGYGERVGYGKGLTALFSGPPGTGKTMLAMLIARALDLDIYQVDLAQVVSKWVGETEKQLAKVFDQAERAHAVLLFDEADSLFAKRTEVKTSNDRYGNLAVNYLLQRLEQYEGVAILTTNKDAQLDEALQRRLSMHLHLEIPEVPERKRLWQSFIPPEAPVEKGLDFQQLAADFELSGGYIKNAAVRAAFLAAARGGPIDMSLFRLAAGLELEDMGRVVMRGDDAYSPAIFDFSSNQDLTDS